MCMKLLNIIGIANDNFDMKHKKFHLNKIQKSMTYKYFLNKSNIANDNQGKWCILQYHLLDKYHCI